MALKRFLLGILLLGGLLAFYEFVLVGPPPPKGEQNTDGVDNSRKISAERDIVKKEKSKSIIGGIIDSLLGEQATEDKIVAGEEQEAPSVPETENSLSSTPDESVPVVADPAAKAIQEYLIASSEIQFFNNPVDIQIALQLAEGGNLTKLIEIIQGFEEQLRAFQELIPPEPASIIHEKSLRVTGQFVQLLRDTRDKKRGSVEATWNSLERSAIVAQAQEVVGDIRELVATYNIKLPADILPQE